MSSSWNAHTRHKESLASKLLEWGGAAVLGVLIGAGILLGVIAIGGFLAFITGTVFYFTWNHGAVHFIAACGATVSGINYWTAFFFAWFLTTVSAIVFGSSRFNKNKSKSDG